MPVIPQWGKPGPRDKTWLPQGQEWVQGHVKPELGPGLEPGPPALQLKVLSGTKLPSAVVLFISYHLRAGCPFLCLQQRWGNEVPLSQTCFLSTALAWLLTEGVMEALGGSANPLGNEHHLLWVPPGELWALKDRFHFRTWSLSLSMHQESWSRTGSYTPNFRGINNQTLSSDCLLPSDSAPIAWTSFPMPCSFSHFQVHLLPSPLFQTLGFPHLGK